MNSKGDWRFNFIEWEASRPEEGGGLGINIVNLLDEISSAISGTVEGSGSGKFWEDALHHLNSNLVDLALLAGLEISLPLLRSLLTSAATSPDKISDPKWKEGACALAIAEADELTEKGTAARRSDFTQCRDYWEKEFPNLAEKTRSIITLSFSMLVHPLITGTLRDIFTSDTNIQPEDAFNGKIIIVDLPVQEFRLAGRIANLAWKYCFQIAVLRRVQPADRKSFLRPVFLWADEAHNFVSKFDSEYQAVARSAAGCTVYLTQNRESFRRVLKNNDAVDSLLGNLQCKVFCQGSGETNEWASKLLGEQVVRLAASLASGEISPEAIDDENVRQHAAETSGDLARIGLADDRLNRDLIRMFKLSQTKRRPF